VQVNPDRRHEKAARPAQGRGKHCAARTAFFDPAPAQGCGSPKEKDREAENPAELGELPITGRRSGNADQLGHRQVEDAEGVGLADAEMNAEGGRRDQPSAVAGRRDGAIAAQKR
jgi:hypothetical protein